MVVMASLVAGMVMMKSLQYIVVAMFTVITCDSLYSSNVGNYCNIQDMSRHQGYKGIR